MVAAPESIAHNQWGRHLAAPGHPDRPTHQPRSNPVSDLEKIEMARYRREVVEDMRHMVAKYSRIMEWDVPEVDEGEARALVLTAIREALAQVEAEQ
jgi:hypothetical protein